MNLNVSDDQLKQVIAGAILETITPEKRNELLREAVGNLLIAKAKYNEGKTVMQEAFEYAVQLTAREMIDKKLKEDVDVIAKIKLLIDEAVIRAIDGNRENLIEKMASNFAKFLAGERMY